MAKKRVKRKPDKKSPKRAAGGKSPSQCGYAGPDKPKSTEG